MLSLTSKLKTFATVFAMMEVTALNSRDERISAICSGATDALRIGPNETVTKRFDAFYLPRVIDTEAAVSPDGERSTRYEISTRLGGPRYEYTHSRSSITVNEIATLNAEAWGFSTTKVSAPDKKVAEISSGLRFNAAANEITFNLPQEQNISVDYYALSGARITTVPLVKNSLRESTR